MDERRHNRTDPWDNGVYETGRTRPPKSHGGIVAGLLVVVIFLGGLVSALSVLNVKLFAELNHRSDEDDQVSFVSETSETDASAVTEATLPTEKIAMATESGAGTGSVPFVLNPSPESVENIPQEGGLSLQEIYEKNIDSVVSISCTLSGGSSSGTGVILSQNGYIVTNCHVVDGAQSITVQLTDERTFQAGLIGADAVSDLAVLHVAAEDLTAAEFGDSSALRVGDSVVAIGDPLGVQLRGSMTNGGPLINCYGQVIGINTMKIGAFTDEAGVEGLGFAIPSTTVKEIVEQLISQGYVSGRPTLGITGESVSNFYQRYYRLPEGLFINEVADGSAAAEVGIQPGDILISIDDTRITTMDELNTVLYGHEVGDTVNIIIYRSGVQYTADLMLTESKG